MFYSACFIFPVCRVVLLFLLASFVGDVYGKSCGGSGIIPYTFKKGRAYIFLGKDSWDETWSNFGGGYEEQKDKSFDDTAAREGFEETMGVFLKPEAKDPNPESNETAGAAYFKNLFNDDYTVYRNKRPTIFFVQVPFIKASHFRRVLRSLEKRNAEEIFLEKDAFAWVRLSRFKKAMETLEPSIKVSKKCTSWSSKDYKKKITLSWKFLRYLYLCNGCNDQKNQILTIFSYIQNKCDYDYRKSRSNDREIYGRAG